MTEPSDPSVVEPEEPASPGSSRATRAAELRTFLIADIRGYTTYTREQGDEAGAALATRFGELVEEVISRHEGFVVELRGDEALVVFVSARRALRAAIDLQARFLEAKLPRGVGIGLDAGEAIPVGDGFRGTALNLAARLCAEAGPGETLASEAVIHLAAKMDGIAYVDPRALRLKGYSDAVRVVDVIDAGMAKGRRLAAGSSWGGSRRAPLAIGGGLVAVLVVGVLVASQLLGAPPAPSPSPTSVAASPSTVASEAPTGPVDPLGGAELPVLAFFNAETGALKATTPITAPRNIAFYSAGSYWILDDNRSFSRIDPATHMVVQTIPVTRIEANGYNFDDTSIWVTDLAGPHVIRIDKRTGVEADFPFGKDEQDTAPAIDVAVGGGSVWLARPDTECPDPDQPSERIRCPEVTRIDAQTGDVVARLDVLAFGLTFGDGALWYARGGFLGRIDAATEEQTFDEVELTTESFLGNIYIFGGYAWTSSNSTGEVWRVDRSGRQKSFALPPGVGEMAATERTLWVTNRNTGELTGIDLATGQLTTPITTGHATLGVAASADEVMIAVGPTADEVVAGLEGSVLRLGTSRQPWWDPAPDPALGWPWELRQTLYLTCVGLLNYPDEAGPDGFVLKPEVAADLPAVSDDQKTYTFTIKPGFMFSPPSNEPLTAETFRASIERSLSRVFDDGAPGPTFYGDILGAQEYRDGTSDTVAGLEANGDQLKITLVEPSGDFLQRLSLPFACPVPAGTPALRSGLNPEPPIGGAGPYYLAQKVPKRLVVLLKNPNYHGPRAQPFDAITIKQDQSAATMLADVQRGNLDAAMLEGGDPLAGAASAIAMEWGPGSANAEAGDQRWFGAPKPGVDYIALNPTRAVFSDIDVRRAVALAIDRAEITSIWVTDPIANLLSPTLSGPSADPIPGRDLEAAGALMNGRTFNVTMLGYPAEWECGPCRDFEVAVTRQLKEIGITVSVLHPEDFPGDALDPGSDIDLLQLGIGTEVPDPGSLISGIAENRWLGQANLDELDRLVGLNGQPRIDAAVEFARRIVDEEALVVPTGSQVFPFFISARLGCAFVQPAIGAVDLLSLCVDGPAPNL